MTFTDIQTAVQNRLNLTSSTSSTRIGISINDRYRRLMSAIGLNMTRRQTINQPVTLGVSTLIFPACEKIINVVDRSVSPYRVLREITVEELRQNQPYVNGFATYYAIIAYGNNSVTIEFDYVPQAAATLYADVESTISTLSGSQTPAFPEDFHDILIHGTLADEYRKLEKIKLAQDSEQLYMMRLSDLRMWIAKSSYLDVRQGKTRDNFLYGEGGVVSGVGGGSGGFNGAQSWTQTGLITFDRSGSGAGSPPFAVVSGSGVVANLVIDLSIAVNRMPDFTHIPQLVGLSVLGVAGNATADQAAITAASDKQVLRRAGAAIGFGAIDVSSASAVSGVMATANGGNSVDIASAALPLGSGQIVFPAAQNPSAGVNTLDDYEEGTWTPVIGGNGGTSGQTYTGQIGWYVKVGKYITLGFNVTLSNKGTITGNVQIQGLPFTVEGVANAFGSLSITYFQNLLTTKVFLGGYASPSTTTCDVWGLAAAASGMTALVTADISNTTQLLGSITFKTSS